MSTETRLEKIKDIPKAAFLEMDSFDQLQMFDETFKDKLVYEIHYKDQKSGEWKIKYELTYVGIKQLVLEMSKKGEPMDILTTKIERQKTDDNPQNDVWYVDITMRNMKTNHTSFGTGEAPVFPWGHYPKLDEKGNRQWEKVDNKNKLVTEYKQQYDPLGRNAAVSKAKRNASRDQIPEMAIQIFVQRAIEEKGKSAVVKEIKGDGNPTEDPSIATNFCKIASHKKDHDEKANKCNNCGKMLRMPQ